MSLINKIFGLGKPILTSKVSFKDYSSVTTVTCASSLVDASDHMALIAFHYAKMLLVVPKNYYGTKLFIETMNKATSSTDFYKSMVLDFSELEITFSLSDPKVKPKERIFITKLFKYSDSDWHVKTGIPVMGPTSEALLSIKELILEIISLLKEDEIKILRKILNKMSSGYLTGIDYRKGKNLYDIPTKCLLESLS